MKSRHRYALVFFAGVLAGGIAAGALVGTHWVDTWAEGQVLGLAEQAFVAREIVAGRGWDLAERTLQSMPASVEAIRRELGEQETLDWALWVVRDLYEATGTEPPKDLRAVLDGLPPRDSCRRPAARDER